MTHTPRCTYGEWIDALFASVKRTNDIELICFPVAWESDIRGMVEHYINLLEHPIPIVDRFGPELSGRALDALSSSLSGVWIDLSDQRVPVERRHRAVSAMGVMIEALAPRHLSKNPKHLWSKLDSAIFMFWDITSVVPQRGQEGERALLDVCLNEMKHALRIEHPVAQLHALHGLSEFHLTYPRETEPIVDDWIASHPHADPDLLEYAKHARNGLVE